jgi:hypothetical protein
MMLMRIHASSVSDDIGGGGGNEIIKMPKMMKKARFELMQKRSIIKKVII